eukprot:scaffold276938_cov32-Tisochrysis_lutea.AAC.1
MGWERQGDGETGVSRWSREQRCEAGSEWDKVADGSGGKQLKSRTCCKRGASGRESREQGEQSYSALP